MVTVELETTDYRSVIYESASKWKETKGRIPKILELNSVPMFVFDSWIQRREAICILKTRSGPAEGEHNAQCSPAFGGVDVFSSFGRGVLLRS